MAFQIGYLIGNNMNWISMLNQGKSIEDVLLYISSLFPNLSQMIKGAEKSGRKPKEIFDYLSNFNVNELKRIDAEYNPRGKENYLIQANEAAVKPMNNIGTKALSAIGNLGATGLGAYALGRAIPKAIQSIAPQIMQNSPQTPPIAPLSSTPAVSQNIAESPKISSEFLIEQMKLKDRIQNMAEAGNNPETISAAIKSMITPSQKKWLAEQTDQPIEAIVNEYVSNLGKQPKIEQKSPEIEPSGKTGQLAAFPNGEIGEVQSVRNGIAKINVNGKERHRKLNELIESPLPEKDLADLYGNLVQSIPEKDRSAMINVAAYDPQTNSLMFRPHHGAYYVYDDIPSEFAEKLKQSMFQAKTTGENFFGSWTKGEASRGAGLYQLIKELQKIYGGKGKEYSRKFETIHSLLGTAEKAHKEKLERKKDEKRKKKRQQRPS